MLNYPRPDSGSADTKTAVAANAPQVSLPKLMQALHQALHEVRAAYSDDSPVDLTWQVIRNLASSNTVGAEMRTFEQVRRCILNDPVKKFGIDANAAYFMTELFPATAQLHGHQCRDALEAVASTVGNNSNDPRMMLEMVLLHLAKSCASASADLSCLRPFVYTSEEQCLESLINFLGNCGREAQRSGRLANGTAAGVETVAQARSLLQEILSDEITHSQHDYIRELLKQME